MGSLTITKLSTVGTIVPGIASTTGSEGWFALISGSFLAPATNQNLLDAVNGDINSSYDLLCNSNNPPETVSIQFGFDLGTSLFSLDGQPPISFNSLPAGFVINQLTYNGATSGVDIASGVTGSVTINGKSTTLPQTDFSSSFPITIPNLITGNPITPTEFIGYILLLSFINNSGGGQTGLDLSNFAMVGTYSIQSFRFTLRTTAGSIGDPILVTSTTGGLNGVTQIQLSYTDPVLGFQTITIPQFSFYIITEQPNELFFYIPPGFGSYTGPITVTIVGDGIQFSGSVVLGSINITFADTSGIYVLDVTQTSDLLYTRSMTSVGVLSLTLPIDDDYFGSYALKAEENSDFYSSLTYPRAVLSQIEEEDDNSSIVSILQSVTVPQSTAIPSPFFKTAFVP